MTFDRCLNLCMYEAISACDAPPCPCLLPLAGDEPPALPLVFPFGAFLPELRSPSRSSTPEAAAAFSAAAAFFRCGSFFICGSFIGSGFFIGSSLFGWGGSFICSGFLSGSCRF
ncbi:hypothetical protein ACLK2H_04420 [Escherichia coli]